MTTPSGPGGGRPDPGLDAIMGERRQLINLTYRLLGSLAEADGGGLVTSFLRPIEGREQIARAWVEIANRAAGTMTFLERTVNGQPGLVARQDGLIVTVFAFDIAGDRIRHIWVVRNPDKLRSWATS